MTLAQFEREGRTFIVTVGGAAAMGAGIADAPGCLYGLGVGILVFAMDYRSRHRSTP
jgi:hypothetical protein